MQEAPTVSNHAQPDPTSIDLDQELSQGFARDLIRKMVSRKRRQLRLTREDQEDFAQTLALGLIRRFTKFDTRRGNWESFVITVLRSCLKTEIKRFCRQRQRAPMPLSTPDEMVDHRPTELDRIDQSDHVQSLLRRLTPEQRELCHALSFDSKRQVGRDLGLPWSTLRDRIDRIRERLARSGPGSSHF